MQNSNWDKGSIYLQKKEVQNKRIAVRKEKDIR